MNRAENPPADAQGRRSDSGSGHSLRFSFDWITRPFFGAVLALTAIGLVAWGLVPFTVLLAITAVAAAREWHRMAGHGRYVNQLCLTTAILWSAIAAFVIDPSGDVPWAILGLGALFTYGVSAWRGKDAVWKAGGVLYLGVPLLCAVWLRTRPHGAYVVLALFFTVWATDTGALVIGNLVGGPKMVPMLSPKKTWSGTIGGALAGAVALGLYVGVLGGRGLPALLFGFLLALIAHAGDLFESWVKRSFRTKDSGSLIPGHGGALDRIDSSLSAMTGLAIFVYLLGLDPLFGAHP